MKLVYVPIRLRARISQAVACSLDLNRSIFEVFPRYTAFSNLFLFQTLNIYYHSFCHQNEAVSPWLKPRVRTGEVATFDRIAYVGCLKVKKSYLVIKDSIAELLEKVNPKDFKSVSLEVHPGEIRLTETNSDKLLQEHALPWILSIGVFDRDPRLFGYIKTEAKQGEKTRMFCHVFRCGRITTSVTVTEAIRLGCQASYMTDRGNTALNRRRSSNSISSQGSTGESSCSLVRRQYTSCGTCA